MQLSIVTTLYCSAPYLDEFYQRISTTAQALTPDYEIIFVNDGSPDHSRDLAIALCQSDPRVKVVDLSRNFGHHKAVMTGLAYTQGEYVFLIDCDLEEAPEYLAEFWTELHASPDVDVVYSLLKHRKGKWFEQLSGELFYRMFNWLSETKIPRNNGFCRLVTRPYVEALLQYQEQELFLNGIWYAAGFTQKPVPIGKTSRNATTYTLQKKLALFVNALTSFSSLPLMYISFLGLFISLFTCGYIIYLILRKIFFGMGFTGYTTIIVSIWLFSGIIISSIGIVGIYLAKIFSETKRRPYTIVRAVYENTPPS